MANQETSEERDALLDAVLSLTAEVRGIQERLDTIYAPRDEVTREGRRRAWRFLGLAVVIILVSQALTTTMVSTCFLSVTGHTPVACRIIPGYGKAMEQSNARLSRFETILDGIEGTNKRVDDIDRRLKALEARKNG